MFILIFFFQIKNKMSSSKECVATYCKAQADINKIDKLNEDAKKALNERIKTCRSLLTDELTSKKISCIEVFGDNDSEPIYFRLKQVIPNANISMEAIQNILESLNKSILNSFAEKNNNDLPKMVCASIQNYIKEQKQQNATDKTSLSISNNRERGFVKEHVSDQTISLAKDLLSARKELSELKQKTSNEKKESINKQKEVEKTVKEALKMSDPQNMTSRVHMMHGDNEWVYYLRCKETERQTTIGIRKIIPMVEKSVATLLDEQGLSREYNESLNLNNDFWNALALKISKEIETASNETKQISKLSLDRGAPRQKKKI